MPLGEEAQVPPDPLFAARLRDAMGKAGVRPMDLATVLKVGRGTVSRWRRGVVPSDYNIGRIAPLLEVSFAWLKTGEEPAELPAVQKLLGGVVREPTVDVYQFTTQLNAAFERGFTAGWIGAMKAVIGESTEESTIDPPPGAAVRAREAERKAAKQAERDRKAGEQQQAVKQAKATEEQGERGA